MFHKYSLPIYSQVAKNGAERGLRQQLEGFHFLSNKLLEFYITDHNGVAYRKKTLKKVHKKRIRLKKAYEFESDENGNDRSLNKLKRHSWRLFWLINETQLPTSLALSESTKIPNASYFVASKVFRKIELNNFSKPKLINSRQKVPLFSLNSNYFGNSATHPLRAAFRKLEVFLIRLPIYVFIDSDP